MIISVIQLVKYAIAGGTSGILNLIILYILTTVFGLFYILSAGIAFLISMTTSFFINERWTFHVIKNELLEYEKYFSVNVVILFLDLGILYFLVEYFGLWYLLAQAIAVTVLGSVNFVIQKNWTFKK